MNVAEFQRLLTPTGQAAITAAAALQPSEAGFLSALARLERDYPPGLARPALEIAILRREAAVKFPQADRLYFTRPALEQASAYAVASYRARRFAGCDRVLDLGCSVGGDSLALAAAAPVLGLDLDALRLAMARANLTACADEAHFPADFIRADLTAALPVRLSPHTGLFFDPARRTDRGRVYSVRQYQPPLSSVRAWAAQTPAQTPALAVKISPGVNLEELRSYDCAIEFISLHGELKEALLNFGPLGGFGRRATLLPGPFQLSAPANTAADSETAPRLSQPQAWLYEPDPAVLRAGLVRLLAEQIHAAQLDADIAYLTAPNLTPTPFARAWQVEAWFPFQLKRLRAELRARGVGRVTVKKRGSPIEPEQLIRALRLKPNDSAGERVLFLTHLQGRPIVILAWPEKA